jgi:aspartyl-tRNA synthetase
VVADLTDEFNEPSVTFNAFRNVIKAGGVVRGIPAPGAATQPRSWFDKLNEWARSEMGAAGLGYIVWEGEDGKGPIAKFVPADVQKRLRNKTAVGSGDCVFFIADKPTAAAKLAGAARSKIGEELGVIAKGRFEFCWIVDFPMYEWNEEEKRIDFSHNPFSMPNMEAEEFLALDPTDRETILSIKAIQYDIVCNGVELSSGAIRNHRPDVMRKAFAIAGYGENTLEQKFGGMLRALSLGAPPHGGIAPGIDRIVMLLCGEENLREVVLFPMNQRAEDLMMGAPSEVTPKQLRELHIRLALPDKSG